jgi:hypothetical protein
MSINNDVFKILVTKGDQNLLPIDQKVDALAVGQLGVFNADTNLSIDTTSPVTRDVYFALGIDKDGDGVMDTVLQSAGQNIQVKNVRHYAYRPHTASQPMIFELAGFTSDCDTDYSLKLELRNLAVLQRQGYNQFSKIYTVKTDCCEKCTTCPSGNCQELGIAINNSINQDEDGLVSSELFISQGSILITHAATADGDLVVTVGTIQKTVAVLNGDTPEDIAGKIVAAFDTEKTLNVYSNADTVYFADVTIVSGSTTVITMPDANGVTSTIVDIASMVVTESDLVNNFKGVCPGIRVTTNPIAIDAYCYVNLKFKKFAQTAVYPSLGEGFKCNGTLTITQQLVFEEGNSRTIAQKEYQAGGWDDNGEIYRTSSFVGVPTLQNNSLVENGVKYDTFAVTYDLFSNSGWQEGFDNLATEIVVPTTDATTRTDLVALLDHIFVPQGFEALADDVAITDDVITNIETTSDKDDKTKDGLA